MSGLSKNGKLVLEAVYKNWLEMYGSQRNETAGQINDVCTILDEIFPPLVTSLQPKQLVELREGFCQLNKPVGSSKSATCNPNGIMFGIMDTACDIKYYYFEICSASKTVESRHFLLNILNSQHRMICFEAQEMFAWLIDEFHFSPRQECMKWLMVDPMIGCWLLDPDQPVSTFSETVERLKVTTAVNQELWKNDGASTSNALNRCCYLLQILSMVAEKLYESLSSQHLWELFTEVELKLTPLLAVMELHGIYVDKSEFQKMNVLLKGRANLLQNAAHKAAGKQFLLTSPKQLRTILYDELKLDQKHGIHVKQTSILKEKSTSESMLHLLEPVHSLPGIILEYRHIQKIKSTYVDGMLQQIKNSTIFTTWEQTATATGRISSSNPNLQAVPKQPVLLSSHIAKGKFPALCSFFNSVISVCRQKGELRTFTGRHRLFPAINSLNPSVSSQAERQAINFLIQGTAADICKAAMLHTEQQLSQKPDVEAYLLLQIHDELLWEVRDSHLGQMKKLVRSVMEDTSSLYTGTPKMIIPLPVMVTTGKTLACMTAT